MGATKVNYVRDPFFDVEFLVDEHVKKKGKDNESVPRLLLLLWVYPCRWCFVFNLFSPGTC